MSIYKECDIRGVYGSELDENTAYEIGRAVGSMMSGKTMAVCGDVRTSTPALKNSLIKGLYKSGVGIIDISIEPTPVFYFGIKHLKTDGGITVTASHNPARYNGFKLMLGDRPVTPDDIKEIENMVLEKRFINKKGTLKKADVEHGYIDYIKNLTQRYGNLKVVIDAGNGATSKLAPELFRDLGYEVVELFCGFDGTFPNREPNPAVFRNLKRLQEKVLEEHADLGIGFDGDGDRVVFVDGNGEISTSEESFVVFIRHYLKDNPSSVVYDIKSSSIVERETVKYGSTPLMERSGHAFIKRRFLENSSVLAGEISGHFFFKELGHDDGIYAALKMAEILGRNNASLAGCRASISKTLITPDIRIPATPEEQQALLDKIGQLALKYPVSRLDGVRIQFPEGWLLARKSVTEPCITLRLEADDEAGMLQIKKELYNYVPEIFGKHEQL